MLKVCNIDIGKSKEIFEELKKLAEKIKKDFEAEVYLFGSFATGEFTEGSDIDLLIIGNFKGKMPERISEILKLTDLPVEPLCYTKEEFERKKNNPFFQSILKEAKKL